MKCDVLIAGVGGQGVLSAARLLAEAARRDGLDVRQGELHGMSQRGGAVQASVRMTGDVVASALIPEGEVDLVIGLEPVEALRCVALLTATGKVVTSATPVENVSGYPPVDDVLSEIRRLPGAVIVDGASLAREAGSFRALNVVMLGAASSLLPLRAGTVEGCIDDLFAARERLAAVNRRAFAMGRSAATPVLR